MREKIIRHSLEFKNSSSYSNYNFATHRLEQFPYSLKQMKRLMTMIFWSYTFIVGSFKRSWQRISVLEETYLKLKQMTNYAGAWPMTTLWKKNPRQRVLLRNFDSNFAETFMHTTGSKRWELNIIFAMKDLKEFLHVWRWSIGELWKTRYEFRTNKFISSSQWLPIVSILSRAFLTLPVDHVSITLPWLM